MTFAVGGLDGSIHIYDWRHDKTAVERDTLHYTRIFMIPRSITFCFMHGSQFLMVGGEDRIVAIFNLVDKRQVVTLEHQRKKLLLEFLDYGY
jgi:WD40 repeat protein